MKALEREKEGQRRRRYYKIPAAGQKRLASEAAARAANSSPGFQNIVDRMVRREAGRWLR